MILNVWSHAWNIHIRSSIWELINIWNLIAWAIVRNDMALGTKFGIVKWAFWVGSLKMKNIQESIYIALKNQDNYKEGAWDYFQK